MTEDFNISIDNFDAPTGTPEERMRIVLSLLGSMKDLTIPSEVATPDTPRNWEFLDL